MNARKRRRTDAHSWKQVDPNGFLIDFSDEDSEKKDRVSGLWKRLIQNSLLPVFQDTKITVTCSECAYFCVEPYSGLLLSAISPYFRAVLTGQFSEANEKNLQLDFNSIAEAQIFKRLLDAATTGHEGAVSLQTDGDHESFVYMMEIAERFQILHHAWPPLMRRIFYKNETLPADIIVLILNVATRSKCDRTPEAVKFILEDGVLQDEFACWHEWLPDRMEPALLSAVMDSPIERRDERCAENIFQLAVMFVKRFQERCDHTKDCSESILDRMAKLVPLMSCKFLTFVLLPVAVGNGWEKLRFAVMELFAASDRVNWNTKSVFTVKDYRGDPIELLVGGYFFQFSKCTPDTDSAHFTVSIDSRKTGLESNSEQPIATVCVAVGTVKKRIELSPAEPRRIIMPGMDEDQGSYWAMQKFSATIRVTIV